MVAQSYEGSLSSQQWENQQTSPMPTVESMPKPICLALHECRPAALCQNNNDVPRREGVGVHFLAKQIVYNSEIQKKYSEKIRDRVFWEDRTKLLKRNCEESSQRLFTANIPTVAPRLQVKGRNEKAIKGVQDICDKHERRHDAAVVISHEQIEVDDQEQENTSEMAATLLLLADSKAPERIHSPKKGDSCPQSISESEPKKEIENHKPEGSRVIRSEPNEDFTEDAQNSSGKDNEELSAYDDDDNEDQDGDLIMDINDSSVDVQPANEDVDAVIILDGSDSKDDVGKNVNNGHCRSTNRAESKKKMQESKKWLLLNFMVVASTAVVKLSDIEDSYLAFCHENGKDPLATPVLARLIHRLFPGAEKCRLGARGQQRIHYRNLRFKNKSDPKNVTKVFLKNFGKQSENINSKQSNSSGNQNVPMKSVINELQEKQSENGKNLVNQIETEDSPKKKENPVLQDQDDVESCKAAAKKLTDVIKWISSQGENHKKALLRDFAHSASCNDNQCLPVCMMFRRVRRHVVAAKHNCSVLCLYSMLLRNHVSSCTSNNCGLPACPALQKTRIQKRNLEIEEVNPIKRVAVPQMYGVLRPGNIAVVPRSPGGSLPGSPVNSPPLSPEVLKGQPQYLLLAVLGNPGV